MNNQLTVAQVLGALLRHRTKSFLVWSAVMAFVLIGFLIWPRKYASEGRLYVQLGRIATGIAPGAGSASVSVQDNRETEVRSVVEVVKSRAVIEAVVDQVGAERILAGPWDEWTPSFGLPAFLTAGSKEDAVAAAEYERLKTREMASKALEDTITIHAEKKTSVIAIYARASSAVLAREIVQAMFDHTRNVHMSIHAVDGSTLFFDEQFVEQENKVVRAVKTLANFRNSKQVLSIGAARNNLQAILDKLDNQIIDAQVDVDRLAKRMQQLTQAMGATEKQMAMPTSNMESKSFEDSKHMVFQLESERERLVSTYSAIHPEVKRIDNQLTQVRQSLKTLDRGRTESAMTSNPVYEDLMVQLVTAEADHAGSVAMLGSLQGKQMANQAKLRQLNDSDVVADQLQRDVNIARQDLSIYAQKRGEAKAMSIMDKHGISDIKVAQAPTLNVKHISPKGSLILPMGAALGFIVALAASLFFERNHLSPTLNESEIEQILELPVLVTLPRVYSSRNMVS